MPQPGKHLEAVPGIRGIRPTVGGRRSSLPLLTLMAGFGLFGLLGALGTATLAQHTRAPGADREQLFRAADEAQQRGDAALAVSKYQDLLQLYPDMPAAHANLGVLLTSLGRYDEAIKQYQLALAKAPRDPTLRFDLGLAYYRKGDYAGAEAELASLHQEDPGDLRVSTLLGNSEVQLGSIDQAIALLDPLEKANPDNLELEWALGMALIRSGKMREGLERVQKVADQGHDAETYQLAANLYLRLSDFDEARDDAQTAIRLNPQMPKAHVVLGMVDDYVGDEKGAQEEFERALHIDPKDVLARVELGLVLCNQRKLDDARRELDRALTEDPHSYYALYLLGRVERAQGNLKAAVKDFESAEREQPQWLQPHIELTALYYLMKRPDDGAREKKIVDQLQDEERQRHADTRVILPQVPSQ